MNVKHSTFRFLIRTSFWVSLCGVFVDADHWYANLQGWDARWFHQLSYENSLVLVAYAVIWGLVVFSFTAGWFDLNQ